jgi:hypothetical protein
MFMSLVFLGAFGGGEAAGFAPGQELQLLSILLIFSVSQIVKIVAILPAGGDGDVAGIDPGAEKVIPT